VHMVNITIILFYSFLHNSLAMRVRYVENVLQIVVDMSICIYCCLSVNVMDDWKLKTSPVVRLQRPSKTFVFNDIFFFLSLRH